MPEQPLRLYGIALSHPVIAVRGMLGRKRLSHRYVELLAGLHPLQLLARGFRGPTVPALELPDGSRVQGSLAIAKALEALAPLPSLYPDEPGARAAAEAAERWGEAVLQPIPRRLIRWGLRHSLSQRQWFAEVATPFPAPALVGIALSPVVPVFTWQSGASEERVRRDLDELPSLLDEVDRLLAEGVIGREELGAADFQIAATVGTLAALGEVGSLVARRPAEAFARRVVSEFPHVPATLPMGWMA
jgi:glutathione S-transferase